MQEITIYELLESIKEHKAPRRIKNRSKIYTFSDYYIDYQGEEENLLFANLMKYRDKCLNNKVEVLDEGWCMVSKEQQVEILKRRLKHLLESDTIKFYDTKNTHTKEYEYDIKTLDNHLNHYAELLSNDIELKLLTSLTSKEIVDLIKKGHTISFEKLNLRKSLEQMRKRKKNLFFYLIKECGLSFKQVRKIEEEYNDYSISY